MPAPQTTIWPIDRHTQAKHEILRRYLEAWFPILIQHFQSARIVDGFAGPGEYKGGQSGSPLIALDVLLKHPSKAVYDATYKGSTELIFIEQDGRRSKYLQQRVLEQRQELACAPNLQTHIITGTFVIEMEKILHVMQMQQREGKTVPTFVFIDPFGYSHTPLKLIKDILSFPSCEVLITVMAEEINRFLGVDYRTKEQHYDDLFGTDEWRQIMKETTNPRDRMSRQHDLYLHQLLKTGKARYVRSFCMRNNHNATDYFLFFATNSLKGLGEMKRAMWKVDATGAFEFSDFSNPYQPLLLNEPNNADLQQLLSNQFKGQTVSIETIEEYVLADTPYFTYKDAALKPMELAIPPQIQGQSTTQGHKRKRGDYPAGKTLIKFPQTIVRAQTLF
jgi:three-Cys-motif partner protein